MAESLQQQSEGWEAHVPLPEFDVQQGTEAAYYYNAQDMFDPRDEGTEVQRRWWASYALERRTNQEENQKLARVRDAVEDRKFANTYGKVAGISKDLDFHVRQLSDPQDLPAIAEALVERLKALRVEDYEQQLSRLNDFVRTKRNFWVRLGETPFDRGKLDESGRGTSRMAKLVGFLSESGDFPQPLPVPVVASEAGEFGVWHGVAGLYQFVGERKESQVHVIAGHVTVE